MSVPSAAEDEPVRLVLVRHGRTAWNDTGRLQGQTDVPLDDLGHRQAQAVAPAIAAMRPAALWTSDLMRAAVTAGYVATATGLAALPDPRLRERRFGDREGLTPEEYHLLHPAEYAAFRTGDHEQVPGAEPAADVRARLVGALRDLVASVTPGSVAVAVSHGAAIRLAVGALVGWDAPVSNVLRGLDNCAWAELHVSPAGHARLAAYNRSAPIS